MALPEFMSDEDVLQRLASLVRQERENLPELLSCLAEVDRRKLYAPLGYSSTFDYCLEELRYSEGEAFRRIQAARVARLYMEIYSHLADGSLNLSAVSALAPYLNRKNAAALLSRAVGKRKREIELIVAELEGPRPLPPDRVRPIKVELPTATVPAASDTSALPQPLALPPREQKICFEHTFVATPEFESELDRLRSALSSKYPFGRLEDYLREAVTEFLDRREPAARSSTHAEEAAPAKPSRYIPRAVRDAVWARDGGRCAFVAPDGRRCECRRALQLDHIIPFSEGGKTTLSNLRLLCPEHNQLERRRKLGEDRRTPGEARRASLKLLKEESAQLPLPS